MKKKFSRRFLSLALALLLVCQLAVVASAATRSWTSGSNKYYAVLTSSNSSTSYVNTPFSKFHTAGTATTITATYTTTCSKSATNTFPSSYSGNVVALLNSAGFVNSTRFGIVSGKAVTVPAGSTTGTYYLTVAFPGNSVSITVYDVTPDANGNATQTRLNTYSSSFTPKSSGMYITCRLG